MQPGQVIGGRFEIERWAGSGGMGDVFRARDRLSGEAVAVKVLRDGRASDGARFAREAEVLSDLHHPGIVRYVAHGVVESGAPFLVMEWLEGEDVMSRLRRQALTVDETVALLTRAAEALAAAHTRGVIHRDLKPSNIFLVGGDVTSVKLLDFGLARFHRSTRVTRSGILLGTPEYMAPEQARGDAEIDARVDVFSLGCVLFECLTGSPAFSGEQFMAVLTKILFAESPRVSELCPEISPALDALCAKMLAKDPKDRPASGAVVAAQLAALGGAPPPSVSPPSLDGGKVSLTPGEQRVLSVILIASPPDAEATASEALVEQLRPVAEARGGSISALIDGSILIKCARAEVPTDQAAQAARCALALRARIPDRSMALAMGRAEAARSMPSGDAIDRAAAQLTRPAPRADGLSPIAVDQGIAGLLDARFEIVQDEGGGLWLRGEHGLTERPRTLLGKPTTFVGREWEMGMLEAALRECIDESTARAVLVTGPAGQGKSRLAYEVFQKAQELAPEIAIWIGRVDSLRAGVTLDLLRQALRGALGVQEGEPLAVRREKINARVAQRLPAEDRRRVTDFLGELLDTPFPDHDSAPLRTARQDAQLMSEQIRRAWIDLLRAEVATRPVLLVLEDLHWGDPATVRFVDTALRDLADQPFMVLALGRPEVHEVFPNLWVERRSLQEIRLKELTRRASEKLLREALGDGVGPATAERVVQQADGNAFYLEELIRAVAEGRGEALPETVLAMVEARLGRLPGDMRQTLRAASVFGEVCWEGGVSALLGGAARAPFTREWLNRLVDQEVLVERTSTRFPGEREFAFRHALLREGAYARLTEEDRRLGHRVAGDWLERVGEADPMVLAGHLERGGESARAGAFYLRAAEQANRSGDGAIAAARARLGLACEGTDEIRIALLGILCESLSWAPQTMSAAMPHAEEAMARSPRGSIPWAQGAFAKIGGTFIAGRIDDFVATLKELQETEPAPGVAGLWALALVAGTSVLDLIGRARDGDVVMDRLAAVIRSRGVQEPVASMWWNAQATVRNAYAREDPHGAVLCAAAGMAVAEAQNHEHLFAGTRVFQGMNLWYLGAYEEAERNLMSSPIVDAGAATSSAYRRFSLAWLRADRGALDEARATATELRDFGHAHGVVLDEGRGRWALAEVLRRQGDLEGAGREIEAALALVGVSALDTPGALGTLSALRLAEGRVEEARDAAERALSRIEAMDGACGMFRGAFVRLVHAEALHAAGEIERAGEAIAKASARLFVIAERIADPDYRRSFLERVPENARTLELSRSWRGRRVRER